jgi:hypothetical protein
MKNTMTHFLADVTDRSEVNRHSHLTLTHGVLEPADVSGVPGCHTTLVLDASKLPAGATVPARISYPVTIAPVSGTNGTYRIATAEGSADVAVVRGSLSPIDRAAYEAFSGGVVAWINAAVAARVPKGPNGEPAFFS